jgi:MbtH protein
MSDRHFSVVLNDEEQYSIWPADRDIPACWRAEGTTGTKDECIAHIEQVWVDMRPRSLR